MLTLEEDKSLSTSLRLSYTVYRVRILVAKITQHTMNQPRAGVWLSIQSTIPQKESEQLSSMGSSFTNKDIKNLGQEDLLMV